MRKRIQSVFTSVLLVLFGVMLMPQLSLADTLIYSDTNSHSGFGVMWFSAEKLGYVTPLSNAASTHLDVADSDSTHIRWLFIKVYSDSGYENFVFGDTSCAVAAANGTQYVLAHYEYSPGVWCDAPPAGYWVVEIFAFPWNMGTGLSIYQSAYTPPSSTNPRRAVVLEAFYALRPSHDGGCNQTIPSTNGDCVSSWNFLDDQNYPGPLAMSTLNNVYGYPYCLSSDWAVSSDACYASGYTSPSFYSDLVGYGYSAAGGDYGSVGRGGQCVFFANNILYRSQSDQSTLNFSTMSANADTNLQDAVEGDVLFLYGDTTEGFTTNHVAIVVQIYLGTDNAITALDVIDANYITDLSVSGVKVPNREVIARHAFCTGTGTCPFTGVQVIQDHYKIWRGTSYYGTAYDPNQ